MSGARSGRGFWPVRSVGASDPLPGGEQRGVGAGVGLAALGGDPLGAGRDADLVGAAVVADHGAHGVGAVAVVVARRGGRADPGRVEPVVVVVDAAVGLACRGTWPASAGWSNCTPVSMLATTMPSPRSPSSFQTLGALIRSMFHSTRLIFASALPGSGSGNLVTRLGSIRSTSGSFAISAASLALPVTWTALAIQNDLVADAGAVQQGPQPGLGLRRVRQLRFVQGARLGTLALGSAGGGCVGLMRQGDPEGRPVLGVELREDAGLGLGPIRGRCGG